MKYQNKRGGRIILTDVRKPDKENWGSPLEAMQAALELEKQVNEVSI
jgi:ferritin heavy chain